MRAGLHRVLLGWQAESVEPQRVQNITANHPEVARVDVGSDVAERMTDVQPLAGWVGEHVLYEHLVVGHRRAVRRRQRTDRVGHVESPQPGPVVLPGAFDAAGQVRGIAKPGSVGIGLLGRGGRGVGHAQQVIRAQVADPPDTDVSVRLQTGQCLIPGVLQVDSSAGSRGFPLVTVTFCDFEHSSTSSD